MSKIFVQQLQGRVQEQIRQKFGFDFTCLIAVEGLIEKMDLRKAFSATTGEDTKAEQTVPTSSRMRKLHTMKRVAILFIISNVETMSEDETEKRDEFCLYSMYMSM